MSTDKKINILVIPDLFPKFDGDVQGIFVLDYIRSIQPFCNVLVFAPRLSGEKTGVHTDHVGGIEVTRFAVSTKPASGLFKFFLYRKLLKKAVQEASKINNIDLIHAHGSIISGTIASKIAEAKKIPFIVTEHIGPFSVVTNSGWKKRWTKEIIEKANALLCVSKHQEQEIKAAGIQPRNGYVTFNPVDTDLFKPATQRTEHKNMLFVGRLDNFKGGLRCAEAFKEVRNKYPGWKLTIVGAGEDIPAIKNLVKSANLDSSIILKGTLTKKEIAEEMKQADFLVFPSRHESFGLVVAEAMSCGLPVIVTNRTAPKEYMDPSCGILVDPDDMDAIRKAMDKMIRTHSQYEHAAIREKAVELFSLETFGKKLLDIYNTFVPKH